MKTSSENLRVEPELRASFARAAKLQGKTTSGALRELMQSYVKQSQAHMPVTLLPEERAAREDAVNFARASVGLEGFVLSEADEAWANRYINGEIDLDEFVSRK